jgi:hypothetical protein
MTMSASPKRHKLCSSRENSQYQPLRLKNGTAAVELPKRVSGACVLPISHCLASGACVLPKIMGYVCMYHMYVHTYVYRHTLCGSGRALGLSKDTHYVEPGRLVCCEQQSKIVATED